MESARTAALIQLGILCRGTGAEPEREPGSHGTADPGPHVYSGHEPLCRYENPAFQHPYDDPGRSTYELFPDDLTLDDALGRTRLLVFLGAAPSPELLRCLAKQDAVVLVFEPDEVVFDAFAQAVRLPLLSRDGVFCFLGEAYGFNPPLQDMLQGNIFGLGTPAFFMTERIRRGHGVWTAEVIEYLEVLHYRHAVYGIGSQYWSRSLPLRRIGSSLTYDQQLHAYENIPDCLQCLDIATLRDKLSGHTAILVAAGPDLNAKLDYVRANRDRAVVICVNNAVKPLAEAGVLPHFVIINDISIASGEVFRHLPAMPGTILVGHCLAALGGDRFGRKYLFGNHLPEIFGHREDLDAHGSVISAAFSLAVLMGCSKCILVGGQLASDNPWGLEYARGTLNELRGSRHGVLTNRFPQLYPTRTPDGETLYTTLNFRDAALWLAEVVRVAGVACVNTSRSSILYGQGIMYEAEPELAPAPVDAAVLALPDGHPSLADTGAVARHVRAERADWEAVALGVQEVLALSGPGFEAGAMALLKAFDARGVTYLVHRFQAFDNRRFHRLVFEGDGRERARGLRYFLEHVLAMSQGLIQVLDRVAQG
jgi:hypothetical protein